MQNVTPAPLVHAAPMRTGLGPLDPAAIQRLIAEGRSVEQISDQLGIHEEVVTEFLKAPYEDERDAGPAQEAKAKASPPKAEAPKRKPAKAR